MRLISSLTAFSVAFCMFIPGVFGQSGENVDFILENFPLQQLELEQAVEDIEKGDKDFEVGTRAAYLFALDYYLKANSFNPNNAYLNYKIGKCYLNTLQKTKSLTYFEKAYNLDKEVSEDITLMLGDAYHHSLQFEKALDNYYLYQESLSPENYNYSFQNYLVAKKIAECEVAMELILDPKNVLIENVGGVVNSIFPDFNPVINADESIMLFTSSRDSTTGGERDPLDLFYYEDIYSSENKDGEWDIPVNLGKPINTKYHDATISLSPDGQELFMYRGDNGGDLYVCELKGDSWSKPKKLNRNINTPFHESSASFSHDGKTMYFTSDRDGGFGESDIYISYLDQNGEWGEPINLGPTLNTPSNEEGVYMHPDGKTLYFSSQGHLTMGGYDIFKSTLDSTGWSVPENIGYPINTPDDDVFFKISADGRHGYYSSAKSGGYGEKDIYRITFIEPDKIYLTILKGVVIDQVTLDSLEANIEITDNSLSEVVARFKSNSKTGKYLISLPSGRNYGIAVTARDYLFHSENFDIPLANEYEEYVKVIKLKKVVVGSKIILKNIFFDFDKWTLRPESNAELNRLISLLNEVPSMKIEIGGHTDSKGSDSYNQRLSENRARVVVDYLVENGIDNDRLTYFGYGESQPIAPNQNPDGSDNPQGRQLNRRTEFKILSR